MDRNLAARRAAEARALIVALAVARKAGWTLDHAGPALSTPFGGYLYVADAELLLVPTGTALPFARLLVEQATREARSDALVVSCSRGDPPRIHMALGLRSLAATRWTMPVVPWLGADGQPWLISPSGDEGWLLRQGRVIAAEVPWRTTAERDAGCAAAERWLAGLLA